MMSANHQGQGGLFSLLNSLRWGGGLHARPRTWRFFQLLAIAGVALMTAGAPPERRRPSNTRSLS